MHLEDSRTQDHPIKRVGSRPELEGKRTAQLAHLRLRDRVILELLYASGVRRAELVTPPRTPALRTSRAAGPRNEKIAVMPRISSFFGVVITMYHDDHGFPHFHAQHADGHAKVRIDTLEPIESDLPRRQLRFVLAWAELHQAELEENWNLARTGGTLQEIEPLR